MGDRYKYFYPDDVFVSEDSSGNKVAEIGYDWGTLIASITRDTRLPVLWSCTDLKVLHDTYLELWERSRENFRSYQRENFLSSYPSVQKDKESWVNFLSEGNKPSISAWREWEENNLG